MGYRSASKTAEPVKQPEATKESEPTASGMPADEADSWETLNVPVTTVDLVKLANSNNIVMLGLTTLPAGKYTQVRLFLSSASATLTGGQTVNLDILGQDKEVKAIQPFTVVAGKTSILIMDFDAQRSVVKAGDKYILKPVVAKLTEQQP